MISYVLCEYNCYIFRNNVLASLKRLRKLTIHPSGHTLKHIQSYASNASHLQSLDLADANLNSSTKHSILTTYFVSVLGLIHLSYRITVCHQMVTVNLWCSVQSSLNVFNSFPFQYSGITQ
jgi:hypothetical protein